MFRKVLLAFLIAAVVVLVLIVMQPATYMVVRTATIAAPPSTVFFAINDFHRWQAWVALGEDRPRDEAELFRSIRGCWGGLSVVRELSGRGRHYEDHGKRTQ